jgi:hypothetical protein
VGGFTPMNPKEEITFDLYLCQKKRKISLA